MTAWRFIDSGAAPGSWNLALDDALFDSVEAGGGPPTLRIYGWEPPAITIGYGQDRDRDVDLAACASRGIAVLRRSTGGRAVLHEAEVTYSVVAPAGLAPFGRTLDEACAAVAAGLVAALRLLGAAEAVAATGSPQARAANRPAGCFASTSRHEVQARGRKLVGSAQRRSARAFLQHGAIPLAARAGRLGPLLRGGSGGDPPGLEELCGPRSRDDVIAALLEACSEAWGADFAGAEPTAAERRAAARLERERYRSASWNAGAGGRAGR